MSNDVKVTQADEQAAIDFLRSCLSVPWSLKDELAEHFAKHLLRHQPQREAVLEEALSHAVSCLCSVRKNYEDGTSGLWDDVNRAIKQGSAALTTPAPAVTEDDQALLNDIFDKMAEVVAPLPGEE